MPSFHTSSVNSYDISPIVKKIIILTVGIWFFSVVILQQHFFKSSLVFNYLGLNPSLILEKYYIWQIFSYMFIHSNGVLHILFNMFILWMFGSELERLWGSKFFLLYYLFCGAGAALIYLACISISVFMGVELAYDILAKPVIGASGAVFGLLYAYGIIYRERIIYLMMVFPIKAIHFVCLIGAIELISLLNSGLNSPVANLAHLGGLASGALFLWSWKYFQRKGIKRWKREKGAIHLKVLKNNDKDKLQFH